MRNLVLVFLVFSCISVSAAVDATLTGSMQLKGSPKSSESFLDLLKCGLEELPKKFLRKEEVTASYAGANKVTLEQTTDGESKYLMTVNVPSILRYVSSSNKVKKQAVKTGTVGVECASADQEVDNSGSSGQNFSGGSLSRVISKRHKKKEKKALRTKVERKKNKIARFLRNGSSGTTFSVKKIVAVRKGNKGKLKGTFINKADKALGRFAIKFDYND